MTKEEINQAVNQAVAHFDKKLGADLRSLCDTAVMEVGRVVRAVLEASQKEGSANPASTEPAPENAS